MGLSVVTYILSKKYTDLMIKWIGKGFNYRGHVQTRADLPTSGNKIADLFIVTEEDITVVWSVGKTGKEEWVIFNYNRSGEPEKYIRDAAIDEAEHILTLTKKDRSTLDFNPFPAGEKNTFLHKNPTDGHLEWIEVALPYSAPAITELSLLNTSGGVISNINEYATSLTIGKIRHKETFVENIKDTLKLIDSGQVIQTNITKSSSSVEVPLEHTISLDGLHGGKTLVLVGTNTRGADFSKSTSVSFVDFDYCQFKGDEIIPTTATGLAFAQKGEPFNVSYEEGKCIRFISQKPIGTIQQNIMGQWADVTTVAEGEIEFTQKNNYKRKFYIYRTVFYERTGEATYRLN